METAREIHINLGIKFKYHIYSELYQGMLETPYHGSLGRTIHLKTKSVGETYVTRYW